MSGICNVIVIAKHYLSPYHNSYLPLRLSFVFPKVWLSAIPRVAVIEKLPVYHQIKIKALICSWNGHFDWKDFNPFALGSIVKGNKMQIFPYRVISFEYVSVLYHIKFMYDTTLWIFFRATSLPIICQKKICLTSRLTLDTTLYSPLPQNNHSVIW